MAGENKGAFGIKDADTSTPDVSRTPPPDPGLPAVVTDYATFASILQSGASSNAYAYLNKRIQSKAFGDGKIQKVLRGATFIPADESCYQMGGFKVEKIQYFVVHRPGYTAGGSTSQAIVQEFCTKGKGAATHFVIDLAGGLIQMVDLGDVAYHCGTSHPADNSNSVGAELEGAIGSPIPLDQYHALANLLAKLNSVSGFLPSPNDANYVSKFKERVVAHSAIRFDKRDPGPNFKFELLADLYANTRSESDIYRPPISPVEEVERTANLVLAAGNSVNNPSGATVANSMIQQTLATSRLYQLIGQGRDDASTWATMVAQRQSAFFIDRIAQFTDAIAQSKTVAIPINTNNYDSFYDYAEGKFQSEKA